METETKTIPEHGEHFNESIVNEVILEDMKKKQNRSYEISSWNGSSGRVRCNGAGNLRNAGI